MSLTLLLGGARSGKSRLAERLITSSPGAVAVIATAEALDDEMAKRIQRHREARASGWLVVEEPLDLIGAVRGRPDDTRLVIDCLTLWVSNLIGIDADDGVIEEMAGQALGVVQAHPADSVVVSNEVGSGIVPVNALARRYRDLLGRVNSIWADGADQVLLTVAGGVVPVHPIGSLWDGTDND
jgi:adenosyl cobinamide kinase/adenosyl cobinamide phosphate guanylyltransferase